MLFVRIAFSACSSLMADLSITVPCLPPPSFVDTFNLWPVVGAGAALTGGFTDAVPAAFSVIESRVGFLVSALAARAIALAGTRENSDAVDGKKEPANEFLLQEVEQGHDSNSLDERAILGVEYAFERLDILNIFKLGAT